VVTRQLGELLGGPSRVGGSQQLASMRDCAAPLLRGAQLERSPPPGQLDASFLGQRKRRAHDVGRDTRTRAYERGGHEHRVRKPMRGEQRVGELEHGPVRVVERQGRRVLRKRSTVSKARRDVVDGHDLVPHLHKLDDALERFQVMWFTWMSGSSIRSTTPWKLRTAASSGAKVALTPRRASVLPRCVQRARRRRGRGTGAPRAAFRRPASRRRRRP
jgi:hypothetical protein